MDVLKRVPSLSNVYHLARMPDTQIGEWESLTVYLAGIIAQDTTPTRDAQAALDRALCSRRWSRRTWRARRTWRT